MKWLLVLIALLVAALLLVIACLVGLFLLLAVFSIFAVKGRRKQPGTEQLKGWNYAHRGLHDDTRPENSMAAYAAAVDHGFGIELDVHLLKDGSLAVFHDSDLKRITGQEGKLEDLTKEELPRYFLKGTEQTIPLFSDVLQMCGGKIPLIVELKSAGGNHAALTEAACNMLKTYPGVYCMESFDPRCVRWLKQNRPEIIRGQLGETFTKYKSPVPWILKVLLTHQMLNFLTKPDFVAYRFAERKNLSNFLARKLWGLQGVSWTLRNMDEYNTAKGEDLIPIFENFLP